MIEGLIDDEQRCFRSGRREYGSKYLKKILEKSRRVFVGFMDLEKAYDRVNRDGL